MRRGTVAVAVVLALGLASVSQVRAQGFFEKLFGLGGGGNSRSDANRLGGRDGATSAPRGSVASSPWREKTSVRRAPPRDDDEGLSRRDEARPSEEGKGQYHTYCVRSCDGYYFPISRAVPRRSFQKDAQACTQRCGGEARLFYGPVDNDDKAAMVDLSGRSYGELPTAFKYRKTLVAGCACKPAPWSEAELARHRQYALADAEKASGVEAQGRVNVAAAERREPVKLPPPVVGDGVLVMSAEKDLIEQNDTAAALASASGLTPPAALAERPALAASVVGSGPVPRMADARFARVREDQPREAEMREPVEDPVEAALQARRSAGASVGRHAHRRGRATVDVINSGSAPSRPAQQERRQRHAAARPRAMSAAPAFGGFIGGQAKYVYPGDAR